MNDRAFCRPSTYFRVALAGVTVAVAWSALTVIVGGAAPAGASVLDDLGLSGATSSTSSALLNGVSKAVRPVITEVATVTPPVISTIKPVVAVVKPVATRLAPVIAELAPDADVLSPVTNVLSPVIETLSPVSDVLHPVVTVLSPVADAVLPVTAVLAPVTDVLTPVTDVLTPVTDVLTPVTDVLVPVVDTVVPEGDRVNSKPELLRPEASAILTKNSGEVLLSAPQSRILSGARSGVSAGVLPTADAVGELASASTSWPHSPRMPAPQNDAIASSSAAGSTGSGSAPTPGAKVSTLTVGAPARALTLATLGLDELSTAPAFDPGSTPD